MSNNEHLSPDEFEELAYENQMLEELNRAHGSGCSLYYGDDDGRAE